MYCFLICLFACLLGIDRVEAEQFDLQQDQDFEQQPTEETGKCPLMHIEPTTPFLFCILVALFNLPPIAFCIPFTL